MKLTKILIGTAIAIPTAVTPLATVTSCGQQWGRLSAFTIGSAIKQFGPYKYFDYLPGNYLDFDGNDYRTYLQSNYSIKQSSNEMFGYSTPAKWTDDEKKQRHDWKDLASSGWYSASDPIFQYQASYKDKEGKDQIVNCSRNQALTNNISFVASIGALLNTLISNALNYQSSQIEHDNVQNQDIAACWGTKADRGKDFTFNHGEKDSNQNKQYYEYDFALANLNGGQKSSAMLRTSQVNFHFNDFPLPTYKFNGDKTKRESLSSEFIKLIEGSEKEYTTENLSHYTSRSDKIDAGKDTEHRNFTYERVPLVLTVDEITQRYLNPQMDWSFLVNDYYASKNDIEWTIGDQWKAVLPGLTGYTQAQAVPHYKSFTLEMPTENIHFTRHTYEHQDNRLNETLYGKYFIILATYDLQVYTKAEKRSEDKATFRGVSNIFPASWLDLYDTTEDQNWYIKANNDAGHDNEYTLNPDKINAISNRLREIIERTQWQGTKPTALDQEHKNLLSFLGYMFANEDRVINTSDFLKPTNI